MFPRKSTTDIRSGIGKRKQNTLNMLFYSFIINGKVRFLFVDTVFYKKEIVLGLV